MYISTTHVSKEKKDSITMINNDQYIKIFFKCLL